MQTKDLKSKEESLFIELDNVLALIQRLVENNETNIQNQADYEEKYNKLSTNYSSTLNELKSLQATIQDKILRKSKIMQFLKALKPKDEILSKFSTNLFLSLVDRIEVNSKNDIKVNYKNIEGKDS